ncbi:hypothetical protein P3X46_018164 [Hevea brasiliensis]|uniref:ENTH domain-containing protein n=1 Tax=Hevea brasiliensis TaxID=3981 RepID=A0ABQ9LPV7_HEVBR|nr:clathrin coat assembly protein AP180 [Hevea brasiliensis]KAJ9170027.1 hypothetical protein P3X46_018164 [Hevea brasiliensis]
MPSKFRKAIGAVKDQTSISLAKVYTNNTSRSNLEVVILKATRHDEAPVDDRYVKELLNLISSSKVYAASCAQAIGRRIGKTRNWIVALKSLMLVLRIFQDGDPYFPREVLHAMKRGARILNLSTFRDDSNSSPWDYTAFVRTFALYLDERLDCFLTGKLQRRFTNRDRRNGHHRSRSGTDPVCEMKPSLLLDKISFWQRLLDRAIATRPTGAAKTNKLVQCSLYAVVQESFDLYRDISDGLALLLDSFFHLQYQSCVSAFQSCVKATKQFEELCSFYDLCKSIGVGRTSEYPSVQKISEELIETLQEFLKDQASFPTHIRSPSNFLLPAPPSQDPSSSSDRFEACDQYEKYSGRESEYESQCNSLEDLMCVQEMGTSTPPYADQTEDTYSATDSESIQSFPTTSATNSGLDLVSLDDWPTSEDQKQEQEQGQGQQTSTMGSTSGQNDCWEIVLAETASQPQVNSTPMDFFFDQDSTDLADGFGSPFGNSFSGQTSQPESAILSNFFDQASVPEHYYNPFLQDTIEIPTIPTTNNNDQLVFPIDDVFPAASPTFKATPTFCAKNPDGALPFPNEDDPFGPYPMTMANTHESNGCMDQQMLLREQQLWLQHQDKIIAKNMA